VQTTGLTELAAGGSSGQGPGVLTETLLGALGALAVLAFVFGSLLALLPLLVAAVSILSTFLVLLGLTSLTQVNFIVQFLVAVHAYDHTLGLGQDAWDIYLLYGPDTRWDGTDPPAPAYWMTQLGGTNAPLLDTRTFADHARNLLGQPRE
jgi:hypothetical protein